MRLCPLATLLPGFAVCAFAQSGSPYTPIQALYDSAMRAAEQGSLESARITFLMVAQTDPGNALAARAKTEIDAIDLFQTGNAQVQAGRLGPAWVTFRAVAQVYPESPLAKRADATGRALELLPPQSRGPVVKAIDFNGIAPVSAQEALALFDERELALSVGSPCDARELERGAAALAGLLSERGAARNHVKAKALPAAPGTVRIVFTAVRSRTGGLK